MTLKYWFMALMAEYVQEAMHRHDGRRWRRCLTCAFIMRARLRGP